MVFNFFCTQHVFSCDRFPNIFFELVAGIPLKWHGWGEDYKRVVHVASLMLNYSQKMKSHLPRLLEDNEVFLFYFLTNSKPAESLRGLVQISHTHTHKHNTHTHTQTQHIHNTRAQAKNFRLRTKDKEILVAPGSTCILVVFQKND